MSFCSFSLGNLIHFNGFNYQLQNTPQNQSATLFSFELQPQPSKCRFDICTWIFCCYFKLSMLKTNLSFCPPPNQLTDFHISIGCTLSQIQSLMLISIFLSFSFKDMFSFLNFSSLTVRIPLFISVLHGSGTYFLFFILQGASPWWIFPFVCKSSCSYFYLFLMYQSSLAPTFLITLFPFSSLQHCCSVLMKLVGGTVDGNIYIESQRDESIQKLSEMGM